MALEENPTKAVEGIETEGEDAAVSLVESMFADLLRSSREKNEKKVAAKVAAAAPERQWRYTGLVLVRQSIICRGCGNVEVRNHGVFLRNERTAYREVVQTLVKNMGELSEHVLGLPRYEEDLPDDYVAGCYECF